MGLQGGAIVGTASGVESVIQLYFEQTKPDKDGNCKRYKVLAFGPGLINGKEVAETVTLQGSGPHKFIEPFDKTRLEKLGYKLVWVDEDAE